MDGRRRGSILPPEGSVMAPPEPFPSRVTPPPHLWPWGYLVDADGSVRGDRTIGFKMGFVGRIQSFVVFWPSSRSSRPLLGASRVGFLTAPLRQACGGS